MGSGTSCICIVLHAPKIRVRRSTACLHEKFQHAKGAHMVSWIGVEQCMRMDAWSWSDRTWYTVHKPNAARCSTKHTKRTYETHLHRWRCDIMVQTWIRMMHCVIVSLMRNRTWVLWFWNIVNLRCLCMTLAYDVHEVDQFNLWWDYHHKCNMNLVKS